MTVDCSVRDCLSAENIAIDIASIDSLLVDGQESIDINITSQQTYTCMSTLCKECDLRGDLLNYFCERFDISFDIDKPKPKNGNTIKLPVNNYKCIATLLTNSGFIQALSNADSVSKDVLQAYRDCFFPTNMNMFQIYRTLKDEFNTADNLNRAEKKKKGRNQDKKRKR